MPGTRRWQTEALERFIRSTDPNFLVTATPGAGKTRMALAAAKELMDAGLIEQVVVVCPSSHLRTQWSKSAHEHFGLQLDCTFSNGVGAVARDFHGVAVTFAAVGSNPQLYLQLTASRPTIVILDEVHHAGESKSWGDALLAAFQPAVRRLLLSGTPFRSDVNPIPFVRYEPNEDGVPTSCSDYSYSYGRALTAGVVRAIAFNALDGRARWRDAGVVIDGQLDNDDPEMAKKALRTALQPDGEWIPSVLASADAELTRMREAMPDAGGLVVASKQTAARAYAAHLERITGEPVAVATSDEPDASEVIKNFTTGTGRWLVAVQMVSEGVDIPRLAVGVYASTTQTSLFFRQVVGRFIRTRGPDDELCASLFLPSVPNLLKLGREIEIERDHVLTEQAEKADTETGDGNGESMMLQLNLVEPLSSSRASHHSTILSGESFTDAELQAALTYAEQAGFPSNVQPAQVARLVRLLDRPVPEPIAQITVPYPQPSLVEAKGALRKLLQRKVGQFARQTNRQHSHVHHELNIACGDTVPKATTDTLKQRLRLLDGWIGR